MEYVSLFDCLTPSDSVPNLPYELWKRIFWMSRVFRFHQEGMVWVSEWYRPQYGGGLLWEKRWKEEKKETKKDGVWREWHTNGTLFCEKHWKEGKKEGVSRYWFATGDPILEKPWKFASGDPILEKRCK